VQLSAVSAAPGRDAFVATAFYLALTLALTWPLAAGLRHDIPGDFGDPLFTAWALAWDATHLGRGWWNANIFAPHPLSLAYSEHFLAQALQILPVYAATRNPILCYNLLFLSTFVLSGLGMFLLGRELTGSRAAGAVAGLAYAFAPYRIASIPHLQVLSSAWMPFVLFGLRRHFATGRARPLAGAAAAWIAQNLSCGYYLLFFSPIVIGYIFWELTTRGRWTDRRALLCAVAACGIVFVGTAPFLLPYLELRRLGVSPRSLIETRRFSADVYAYFTADPNLRLWGPIAQAWPKAEGLLFPGLTIVVLAVLGAARSATLKDSPYKEAGSAATSNVGRPFPTSARWESGELRGLAEAPSARRRQGRQFVRIAATVVALLIITLLLGYSIRLPGLKITELSRVLIIAAGAGAMLLAVSRDARTSVARWLSSPVGFFSLMTLFAVVMSFGPDIHAKGRVVEATSLYAAFYNSVPGFDGLRVPARYGMIVTLGLAALAGTGVARIDRGRQRRASVIAGALIVLEALAIPIPINQSSTDYTQSGLAPLPASVTTAPAPEVYRFVAQLAPSAVVIELPLGEPAFDIRYMFYSTTHWRRLVNGYSGGAPPQYAVLTEAFKDIATRPDRAWQALVDSTATHAIVHESFYANDRGRRLSDWLRARGAREAATFGPDRVFELRQPSSP
jgi:hypothetical protein